MLLGFGSNSKDLESAYSIRLGGPETVAGQAATRLELIPKSQDVLAHLKRVDLWISEATASRCSRSLRNRGGLPVGYLYEHQAETQPSGFRREIRPSEERQAGVSQKP